METYRQLRVFLGLDPKHGSKVRDEEMTYQGLPTDLLADHVGEWIAIHGQTVVAIGPDREGIYKRFRRTPYVPLFIRQIAAPEDMALHVASKGQYDHHYQGWRRHKLLACAAFASIGAEEEAMRRFRSAYAYRVINADWESEEGDSGLRNALEAVVIQLGCEANSQDPPMLPEQIMEIGLLQRFTDLLAELPDNFWKRSLGFCVQMHHVPLDIIEMRESLLISLMNYARRYDVGLSYGP